MIRSILYDSATQQLRQGGTELFDDWQRTPTTSIWVILEGEEPAAEAACLSNQFGIHKLAIMDALRTRHPPKIEPFDNYTFIILKHN